MFERFREWRDQARNYWQELHAGAATHDTTPADDAERFLVFFRPSAAKSLPQPLQNAVAVGTLSSIAALGGVALVCLAGMLIALFGIYLLVTEVLGIDLEVDPRFWRQTTT